MKRSFLTVILIIIIGLAGCYSKRTAEFYNDLGDNFRYEGKYEIAEKYYKKAISYDDEYADAYYNLGLTYYYQKKYDAALEMFQKACGLEPDNEYYQSYVGETYYAQKNYEKAIEIYQNLVKNNNNNYNTGSYYQKIGLMYIELEDYEKAIESYKLAIETDEKSSYRSYTYNLELAKLYDKTGKKELAIEQFEEALKVSNNYNKVYYDFGKFYEEHKDYELAIRNYKEALKENPDLVDARKRLKKLEKKLKKTANT